MRKKRVNQAKDKFFFANFSQLVRVRWTALLNVLTSLSSRPNTKRKQPKKPKKKKKRKTKTTFDRKIKHVVVLETRQELQTLSETIQCFE